mmetsp:Transcript_12270/g.33735  ORF Transcript_12270/g.33735 Transcript_12270/m.33735 type:complete len:200 (+) Transcript_12270:58-657(+)
MRNRMSVTADIRKVVTTSESTIRTCIVNITSVLVHQHSFGMDLLDPVPRLTLPFLVLGGIAFHRDPTARPRQPIERALALGLFMLESFAPHLQQFLARFGAKSFFSEHASVGVIRHGAAILHGLFSPVSVIDALEGFAFGKSLCAVAAARCLDVVGQLHLFRRPRQGCLGRLFGLQGSSLALGLETFLDRVFVFGGIVR